MNYDHLEEYYEVLKMAERQQNYIGSYHVLDVLIYGLREDQKLLMKDIETDSTINDYYFGKFKKKV